MENKSVIVCYNAGSGGHFISAVCEFLLYNNKLPPLDDGSYHRRKYTKNAHNHLHLCRTNKSIDEECQFIKNLPLQPLAISILRNVMLLESLGWKVVYITYHVDQIPEIRRRHDKKSPPMRIEDITEERYNLLKGGGWPTWEEYKNGAAVDELDPVYVRLKDNDELNEWFYILPPGSNNICEITFDEILSGYTLIDKLVSFLNVTDVDKEELKQFVDNYRSKQ